ncbi:MAG: LPS O-antigen chain length determinant protein WzzB [Aeromonas sp.]|uniref:LPS O-antigen chain length determinant protein WzzB n=1 Tax=Aeromonas sp. TaxID=647 RepID=UPI003F30459A
MNDRIDNKLSARHEITYRENEIDLYELISLVWKKKFRILLVTCMCSCLGLFYAMTASEQWTANATIYQPKPRDTLELDRLRAILNIQGLAGTKSNTAIYDDFLLEFKSYNNVSDYLQTTAQFESYVKNNNLNDVEKQRLLRTWSDWMKISPEDKKGEQPGIHLSFSFFDKSDTLPMLTGYIDYIVGLQSKELFEILENNRNSQIENLRLKIKLRTEDAKRNLAREIEGIEYSMSIANAAGVSKPLENFNYGDRFPITLGKNALERKLAILKSLKIEDYMPEIMELKVQLNRLENISFNNMKLVPFSYLDTPSSPLRRDKPKRPLIVILATMLGGMLGVGMVLVQHAFRQEKRPLAAGYDYQPKYAKAS